MKKHTVWEHVDLWLRNLKYRRLLPVNWARDPFGRSADWYDLPFVSFGCWRTTIPALLNKEKIPGTVILVGAPFTMNQWDETCAWARQILREHPEIERGTYIEKTA